jgi:hypothetical protein
MTVAFALGSIVFFIVLAQPLQADVIELKSGERVEGKFTKAAAGKVTIEIGGQPITIEQEKVRAIYFGVAPTSGAAVTPSAFDEALRALKALQSVTRAGVVYREYSTRVNDAKIVVDRFVQDAAAPAEAKSPIQEAMEFYIIVAQVWNARITSSQAEYHSVGRNPALDRCPEMRETFSKVKRGSDLGSDPETRGQIVDAVGIQPLWSCASTKIAEAEKLAK